MKPLFLVRGISYTEKSAGITLLHTLCEKLQERGEFVRIGECHLKPGSTIQILDPHCDIKGQKVILIEPEIIPGGKDVWPDLMVRWLLNVPGKAGPDVSSTWNEGDLIAHLVPEFAMKNSIPLTFGMVDHSVFNNKNNEYDQVRNLEIYYSRKAKVYKNVECPRGFWDISEAKLSRRSLAEIFRKTKTFYTSELTCCSVEALLCGAKHEFIPSAYLDKQPIDDYLKWHESMEKESAISLDNFIDICYKRIGMNRYEVRELVA